MTDSNRTQYGPNTDLILDFLEQCRQYTPQERQALEYVRQDYLGGPFWEASDRAWAAAEAGNRAAWARGVQLAAWMTGYVWVLEEVAVALLVRDLIDDATFDAMVAPLRDAGVGVPA